MLKKSIGFNWGPCAVSTSYWTGVRLGDLLRRAGVKQGSGAGYVSFRGPTGELPKGDDGSYGECLFCAMVVQVDNLHSKASQSHDMPYHLRCTAVASSGQNCSGIEAHSTCGKPDQPNAAVACVTGCQAHS